MIRSATTILARLKCDLKFGVSRALNLYKGSAEYRWTFRDIGDETQVVMRRLDGPEREMRLRAGTSDIEVFEQVFQLLQYSTVRQARHADLQARYAAILAAGKVPLIIDAGANVGLAAVYYRDVYPESAIVCVEPEPGNFAEIGRNTGGDPLTLPLQAALAGSDGKVDIVYPGGEAWGFRTQDAAGEDGVPAYSVDTLIAIAARRWDVEPFIVKIDIEGFESGLFDDDAAWIDRFYLLVIELHDWMLPRQGTAAGFLRAIAARDRDFVPQGENIFSFSNAGP